MNFKQDIQAEDLVLVATGEKILETVFQRCMALKNWELKTTFFTLSHGLKALQSAFFPFATCSSEKSQVMRRLCGKAVGFLDR